MKKHRIPRKLISVLLCLSITAGLFSGAVPVRAADDTGKVSYGDGSFSASSIHDTATPTGWRYTTVGLILHKTPVSGGNVGTRLGITPEKVKSVSLTEYHEDGENSYVIIGRNGFYQEDTSMGNSDMTTTTYTVTNAEGIYSRMKEINAELTDATWYMSAVIEVTLRLATGTDGSGAEEIGSTSRGAHYMMSGGSVTGEYNITAGNVAN